MVIPNFNDPSLQGLSVEEKKKIAYERGKVLKEKIQDYLDAREFIPTGFSQKDKYQQRKKKIMELLNASEKDWNDWKWQVRHRFYKVEDLIKVLELSNEEKQQIEKVGQHYRWAISPYYLSDFLSFLDLKDSNIT